MKHSFSWSSILVTKVFSAKWPRRVGILVLALFLTLAVTFSQVVKASGRGGNSLDVRAGSATPTLSSIRAGAGSATPTATPTITPMPPIIAQPANPSNDSNPSFSFYSSNGDIFVCALGSSATTTPSALKTPCSSPKVYTNQNDGSFTFWVQVAPSGTPSGNIGSFTWLIDTIAPNTTLTGYPSSQSNNVNPVFNFTSPLANYSGGVAAFAGFECRYDGAVFSPCSGANSSDASNWKSSQSYSNLPAGSHTFQVRARDAAGNFDPTPYSYTWIIDLTPPDVSIVSSPPLSSSDPTPLFGFSSTDTTASFECSLDNGAFALCVHPKDYDTLQEGVHAFSVRAKDPAGNVSPIPASYTWEIDLTRPSGTRINLTPPNLSNLSSATFSFYSNDGATIFACQWEQFDIQQTPQVCTNTGTVTFSNLAEGAHTLYVQAMDRAGNIDKTPASYTWTIDVVFPDVTIVNAPLNLSNDPNPGFGFYSHDSSAIFEYRLDDGPFVPCATPSGGSIYTCAPFTPTAAITPTVTVTPTITLTLIITLTPTPTVLTPTPTLTAIALTPTSTPSPTGTDTSTPAPALTPTPTSTSSATSPRTSTISPTPSRTLTSTSTSIPSIPSSTPTLTPTITFTPAPTPTIVSVSFTDLTGGSHVFQVRARDAAGNMSTASHVWTIDLTSPAGTDIFVQPPVLSTSATASFAFSNTDLTATFECALDDYADTAFKTCAVPATYTGLKQGSHTFYVRARDPAGNVEPPVSDPDNPTGDLKPVHYTWTVQIPAQRIVNGGFNSYSGTSKVPVGWAKNSSWTTLDGKDIQFKQEGAASVKLVGNGKAKTLTQTWNLATPGLRGSPFNFSFYLKGLALPAAGVCTVRVTLYSATGGLSLPKTISCPSGTYGFTKKAISFTAPWAFNKVVIQFTFSKPSGATVWFDLVSLLE